MSKNKRLLIILLAIAAALGIAVAVILMTAPDENASSEEPDETVLMYSVARDEFTRAVVTNGAGGFTLEKTEDGFTVAEDEGYATNSYSTGWVGDKLLAPNASRRVSSPGALAEYGLDSPAATCRVELSGGAKTLLLGNAAPSGGYYMSIEGEPEVYIVTHNLPVYMQRSAAWYVETDVIPSKDDYPDDTDTNVKYVFLGGKARRENVEIQMDPDYVSEGESVTTPYVMTQPIDYPVNSSTAGELISYAPAMTFSECVEIRLTPERLAAYGLDDPDYILIFRFADTQVRIVFSDAGEYCYAAMDGFDAVFKAYPTYTSFLSTPAENYMSRLTFTKALSTLSGLTATTSAGKTYVFRVDHDEDGIIPYCGDLKLDADNFKQFYENLIMTLSEGRTDAVPTEKPYLTLLYSFNDGSADVKVEFVPVDSMRYVYLMDGEGGFFMLKSQVDAIASDVALVAENKPVKTTI